MMLEVKTAVILRKERKRGDYESPKGFWDSGNVLWSMFCAVIICAVFLYVYYTSIKSLPRLKEWHWNIHIAMDKMDSLWEAAV